MELVREKESLFVEMMVTTSGYYIKNRKSVGNAGSFEIEILE